MSWSEEEKPKGGEMRIIDVTKEKRIVPAAQPEPDLGWVAIDDMIIDDDYQRPLLEGNWRMIRRIAENFLWSKFTPVILARMPGGKFAIIDGQNRSHAARICGFEKVPAMIVNIPAAEQASAFSWINGNTTKITIFHIYKAALAAGEDWAVKANRAVSDAGCRLMTSNSSTANKKSGEIYAIALIRQCVEKGQDKALTAALSALREYEGDKIRVPLYSAMILRPWITAVCADKKFLSVNLANVLRANDPFRVIDNIEKAKSAGEFSNRPRAELERSTFRLMIRDGRKAA